MNAEAGTNSIKSLTDSAIDAAMNLYVALDAETEYPVFRALAESFAMAATHSLESMNRLSRLIHEKEECGMQRRSSCPDVEYLRHLLEVTTLERNEAKLKAKRLGVMLSYTERRNKRLREMNNG